MGKLQVETNQHDKESFGIIHTGMVVMNIDKFHSEGLGQKMLRVLEAHNADTPWKCMHANHHALTDFCNALY